MRKRIDVTFTPGTRTINTGILNLTIDDIRVIINETTCQNLGSSLNKFLISDITDGDVTYVASYNDGDEVISFPPLVEGDHITFEIDQADDPREITSQEITDIINSICH